MQQKFRVTYSINGMEFSAVILALSLEDAQDQIDMHTALVRSVQYVTEYEDNDE
jgi:hypothetical protein